MFGEIVIHWLAKLFPVVTPFPSSQEKLPKVGGTELSAPGAAFVRPLVHVEKQNECVNPAVGTEKTKVFFLDLLYS